MKKAVILTTVASATLFVAALGTVRAYDGARYYKEAKLTMGQARARAMKLAPGTIKDAELEKEAGGSGLRYSFDIQTPKGLREIGVDAVTGKLLENSAESRSAEAAEARSEGEAGGTAQEHEDERERPAVHQIGEHED
jgi:hypothetical protein